MNLSPTQIRQQILDAITKGKALLLKERSDCIKIDAKLLRLQKQRQDLVADIDAQIEKTTLDRDRTAAPYATQRQEIESVLWDMTRMLGEPFENDSCAISYRNNGMQRNYDINALDALEEVAPEVWKVISPLRTEHPKTPTIKIDWK